MSEEESENGQAVNVSMSIEGEYGEVMSRLQTETSEPRFLEPLLTDAEVLLDTIQRVDGGTRSALAQSLPDNSSLSGDPDAVVELLQVLERYDLVTLEGNTWLPGARLHEK